jgi:Asp-tRNA(Asn)/Glu-tRNA(Gln) amidotransferase A subunit family amidase
VSDPSSNKLTASESLKAMEDGTLTSRALVDACLEQSAARDEDVGAWIYLDPDQARRAADAADVKRAAGEDLGPLHGVPVGLKDILDTADMPTENGSKLHAGRRPATDSTVAHLLRKAGAIIMGKTVTTEFAMSAPGKTKNPHDPSRTPGGSSSGSAASVADFQVPLSIGSQTGGSMIRPASYCGIHGFKPTFGCISRAGMSPLARPLDHPGIYARSIEDIARTGDVLMQKDPADLDMRGHPHANLMDAIKAGVPETAPRIAFVKGPMWQAAEPYMDDLFADVVERLGDTAQEIEMTGIFDQALDCHATVMMANVIANLGDVIRESPEKLHPETLRRTKDSFEILAEDYIKAIEFRDTIAAAVDRIFDNWDVIITPAAPGEAPLGLESTGNAIFQKLWTLVGTPSVTLPKLTGPNGMPIGVQVHGRIGHDGDLLRNAMWIEGTL